MDTRCLRLLVIGVLLVGLLSGCATVTASREDLGGLPRADHPEFLGHPLRMISVGVSIVGNLVQYVALEPMYFVFYQTPEFVGLSLEERRYLEGRQEAWRQYFAGERKIIE